MDFTEKLMVIHSNNLKWNVAVFNASLPFSSFPPFSAIYHKEAPLFFKNFIHFIISFQPMLTGTHFQIPVDLLWCLTEHNFFHIKYDILCKDSFFNLLQKLVFPLLVTAGTSTHPNAM